MSSLLGFILYEGPSLIGDGDIICVATLESSNIKTGNMVQVWILPKDQIQLDALHAGNNESACGSCPLQGTWNSTTLGKMENPSVLIGKLPRTKRPISSVPELIVLKPAEINGILRIRSTFCKG